MKKLVITLVALSLILCGCQKKSNDVSDTEKQFSEIAEKLDAIADALSEKSIEAGGQEDVYFDEPIEGQSEEEISADEQATSSNKVSASHASSSKQKASVSAKSIPSSVEEIVKYYAACANAVKKDKPGFTIVETPTVGEVNSNGSTSSLLTGIKSAAMKLVKASEKSAKKGEDHSAFPVEGQSWATKIEPSFVKKAECKKNGNYYNISIYLKDEHLNALPQKSEDCNTGKVVNVLTEEQIGDILGSIPLLKVKSFTPTFTGCYVMCKINSNTNKMVEATYFMNNIVDIKANGSINVSVDFAIKQEIKINY